MVHAHTFFLYFGMQKNALNEEANADSVMCYAAVQLSKVSGVIRYLYPYSYLHGKLSIFIWTILLKMEPSLFLMEQWTFQSLWHEF